MKKNEKSAQNVRGFLLRTIDGELIFRVYDPMNRRKYKDYQIRHDDLEVQIVDNYSSFFDAPNEEEDDYISYPSRLFVKKEKDVLRKENNEKKPEKAKRTNKE